MSSCRLAGWVGIASLPASTFTLLMDAPLPRRLSLKSRLDQIDTPSLVGVFGAGAAEVVFSATMCHCASGEAIFEMIESILPDGGKALVIVGDKAKRR